MNKKKVLLTGATGLIGKEAILPLCNAGFDVFVLSRNKQPQKKQQGVYWLTGDLFDYASLSIICNEVHPEYLLHFAWYTGEDYLNTEINFRLKEASLQLLRIFGENGGKRVVFAGTCFEYKFLNELLKEDGPLNPTTLYAECKNELRVEAEKYINAHNISFGWGRIFYVFGHGEHKSRLLPTVFTALNKNEKVIIKSGPLIRDYMYTKDIGTAFVKFLDTDITGSVNICSGKGIAIREFVLKTTDKLGKRELIEFTDDCQNQPPIITGDNTRLINEVGYLPGHSIDQALDEILAIKTN